MELKKKRKIEMDVTYIGDGVYAEFDGYGIWLRANVPTTDEIYLEPVTSPILKTPLLPDKFLSLTPANQ